MYNIPTSETFNLSNITIKEQNSVPKLCKRPKNIVGIDTETNINTGNIIIICDNYGRYLDLRNEKTIDSLLSWLFYHQNSWIFTYNISFDAQVMLKLLPEINIFSDKYECIYKNRYKIKYIKHKCLRIQDLISKRSVNIYDLAQYYKVSLDKASNKYLNKGKSDIDKAMFTDTYVNNDDFYRQIYKYCVQDAILCKELGDLWVKLLYKTMGFYPKHFYSTGYISEQYLLYTVQKGLNSRY